MVEIGNSDKCTELVVDWLSMQKLLKHMVANKAFELVGQNTENLRVIEDELRLLIGESKIDGDFLNQVSRHVDQGKISEVEAAIMGLIVVSGSGESNYDPD